MKKLNITHKLGKALEEEGINLVVKPTPDGGISIGKITFKKRDDFLNLNRDEGIILTKSSQSLRENLRRRGVSYFDESGNLFLNSDIKVQIETVIKTAVNKSIREIRSISFSPTNLISPNGLAIIDTLFRLDDNELKSFPSALSFCKRFDLYQPKISLIMSKAGAHDLIELKRRIKEMPFDWWLYAMESPATKRKMSNFFDLAQPHYSLTPERSFIKNVRIFEIMNIDFPEDTIPGPTEVLKNHGELIDNDLTVWVSEAMTTKFKSTYKLIPGRKEGYTTWLLASPPLGLSREELLTHDLKTQEKWKSNIMRAIWDLGFGDSRMREARENLLRRFLNGLR